MKALIYSDLQATDGHEMSFVNQGEPLQLLRVRKFFQLLHRIYEKHECDCLWDLGDTMDDRSSLPMTAIDAVMEGLDPFPNHKLNLKLIGNHEQYLRDTTVHVGRMFASKFKIIDGTEIVRANDEVSIACAAYPSTDGKLAEWLKTAGQKLRDLDSVLLGHFQVVGSKMISGEASTGIPLAALKKFSVSFLGHVHKPQELSDSAWYVGSPFQQNFGERDEDKRVAVFDLNSFDITWVPLKGFPKYRVIPFSQWQKEVKGDSDDRYQVLLANSDEAEAFYKHPNMSQAEPVYDFKLSETASEAADQQKSWSREDVMRRYMEHVPPTSKGVEIPADEVLDYGLTLADSK